MILREQIQNQDNLDLSVMIPAIYNNDRLELKNNGISEVFFGSFPIECRRHVAGGFQFFATSNPPVERPFFVAYGAKVVLVSDITDEAICDDPMNIVTMWELFNVYSKRKVEPDGTVKKKSLQYTCLRQCRPGTLFCKCNECGKHFVLTPQTIKFYNDRDLEIPTLRCQECIQKKRMRYAGKKKEIKHINRGDNPRFIFCLKYLY